MNSTRSPKTYSILLRLLKQARTYWGHLLGIFLLGLAASPLALLKPLPVKIVVDTVLGPHPLPGFLTALVPSSLTSGADMTLLLAAGLILATTLLASGQYMASYFLQTYTGERMLLDFRSDLFRHAQRLSLAFHDRKGATDSTYRIQQDARAIQNIAIYGVIPLATAWISLIVMIVVIAVIDWQLAVVAMIICPALYFLIRRFGPLLRDGWMQVKRLDSAAMSVIQEALTSARVVKAFGREDREAQRFQDQSEARLKGHIKVTFHQARFDTFVSLSMAIGTATVLFVGVTHVQAGVLTLGELLMVVAYLGQLYAPMNTISKKLTDLQSGMASAERAFRLLDEVPEVTERGDAISIASAQGEIAFEGVCFSYPGDRSVLQDITLAVQPGQRVGIEGPTGAGKTTLMSLLMRFYDVDEGRILLDGRDIRDYRLRDLRAQFALVLQDPVLFSASIGENIAYGRPEATEQQVVKAARHANIHEFIEGLPKGYDTEVGDRGMKLSGGERQRIALARAFLKDAPILILDEPTSAVDSGTEAEILEALARLAEGRTTFMIAHRLSTLDQCDLRVQVAGGSLKPATLAEARSAVARS